MQHHRTKPITEERLLHHLGMRPERNPLSQYRPKRYMTPPLHNREAVQLRPLSKGIGRPTVEANLSGEERATHALNGLVDVVGALGDTCP